MQYYKLHKRERELEVCCTILYAHIISCIRERERDLLHRFICNIIREHKRERERDLLHRFICNIISCIREREREREICCTVLYATL